MGGEQPRLPPWSFYAGTFEAGNGGGEKLLQRDQ
jgi:hypothetical protein